MAETFALYVPAECRAAVVAHLRLISEPLANQLELAREETHNGWANPETWAANMWFGGNYEGGQATNAEARELAKTTYDAAMSEPWPLEGERQPLYGITRAGEALREMAENCRDTAGVSDGFLCDLTNRALWRVDWRAVAAHLLEE